MRPIIAVITALHALIHIIGFLKAFNIARIEQLQLSISRQVGVIWLIAAIGFVVYLYYYLQDTKTSWMIGMAAVVISQLLIFSAWNEAKAGTIANTIVLLAVFLDIGSYRFFHEFNTSVKADLVRNNVSEQNILSAKDIHHLPLLVQKYLYYTKSVGKPKILNLRAEFIGGMRSEPQDSYMKMASIQYNFYDNLSRYFYMEAQKMGLPATGLHIYNDAKATFRVKMLNWFSVVDASGPKMDQAETVTLLNDMCFLAPATLIDTRITWQEIDKTTVKAIFSLDSITVSALLYFNEAGELTNFISNDRFHTDGVTYRSYPWQTPVQAYNDINGYRLPTKASLQYVRPDGVFVYGELELTDVRYNIETIE